MDQCARKTPVVFHGCLAGTLIHCILLRKQTFSFSSVTVKNRVRVRVSSRVKVRVYGLELGFRVWVLICNIIGGAAGAHISMTSTHSMR